MKVLTVTNMYPKEGQPYFGIFVQEQVEELRKQCSEENVGLFFIDGSNPISKYLFSAFALFRKIKKFKPDIVHLHFGLTILPMLALLPYLRKKKAKIVLTVHGGDVVGDNFLVLAITKLAIACSDLVVCVSKQMVEKVSKQTSNYLYLPCGVTELFRQKATPRASIVVFPSSPSRPEKNYSRFLQIISMVKSKTKTEFEVALLENMSREEVAALFQKSQVMLMTSDYEGSPQAVKEAIYCGLPVVSTQAGDVAYLLEEQAQCVVSNDDEILTNAVVNILDNQVDVNYSETLKSSVSNKQICQTLISQYLNLLS